MAEQFDADTGRCFYYMIAGKRAQIGGNGLDDYFNALGNFRTIYRDLDDQLNHNHNTDNDSIKDTGPFGYMFVIGIGLTVVEGIWLRFMTKLTETPDEELFAYAMVSVTTLEQHGPLTARWLEDRLDHPALGSPSSVDRQHVEAQGRLSLGSEPLRNVAEHRLIGYRDRGETVECITCANPYYRASGEARGEQFDWLDEAGVAREVIPQAMSLDQFALRPRRGSHGVEEDVFLGGEIGLMLFGTSGRRDSKVMLLSGKTTPMLQEDFEERKAAASADHGRDSVSGVARLIGRMNHDG